MDNAAVELKTLRMASNVPLSRVREGVVSAIVEKIPVVEEPARQRVEVQKTIGRWGELINRIGGVDAVETVTLLQVGFFPCFECMNSYIDFPRFRSPCRNTAPLHPGCLSLVRF